MDHAPDVEELLIQRVEVAPGEWMPLGDCTEADLDRAIALAHQHQVNAESDKAMLQAKVTAVHRSESEA